MTLKLYGHPLSSFCWKALIALYETGASFDFELVNLADPAAREAYLALSPFGKMPALADGERVFTESTTIIERLTRRFPAAGLMPDDPDAALEVRHWDRLFDFYCHLPMQRLVSLKLRPQGQEDRFGAAQARAELRAFYRVCEPRMAGRDWAAAENFTLADCAAAPALYYADKIEPLAGNAGLAAYLQRLKARPSFARVLKEAEPYAHMFPGGAEG